MEAKEAGVQFLKRQRRTGSAAGHDDRGAHNHFPNPQSANEYSSVSHTGDKATEQRLSLESGFRRMNEQHDRARAMILGSDPLNLS